MKSNSNLFVFVGQFKDLLYQFENIHFEQTKFEQPKFEQSFEQSKCEQSLEQYKFRQGGRNISNSTLGGGVANVHLSRLDLTGIV